MSSTCHHGLVARRGGGGGIWEEDMDYDMQTEDPLNNLMVNYMHFRHTHLEYTTLALQTTVYTVATTVCQFAGKFAANSCILLEL